MSINAATPGRSARHGLSIGTSDQLLVVGAVLALVLMMWQVLHTAGAPAFDFHYAYWLAGQRVLAGSSPYTWTHYQFANGLAFVYPALSAVMFAPLSLLPRDAASVPLMLLCIALAPVTLWLLRVRDARLYAVALLWMPIHGAWQLVNESMFLMLGLACVWRWRDRPLVSGLLTAVLISLKPLLWPLVLWLLVTRRWRASAHALALGLVLNLAAWSIVGFGQLGPYLHASGADTSAAWRLGWGLPALAGHFGAGLGVGLAVLVLLSLALVVAVVRVGIAERNELGALVLMVALALVSSPLLWSHYLVLAIVPLAILQPRMRWPWLIPLVMWASPLGGVMHTWQVLLAWAAGAAMFIAMTQQARFAAMTQQARRQPA